MESAYYILTHYRLKPRQLDRQIKALENAIFQLDHYHDKAPKHKRPVIQKLINKYENLYYSITK